VPVVRTRRLLAVSVTAAAIAPLAAGCVSTVTGSNRNDGYAQVALAEAPDLLDPTLAGTFVGRTVFANMCEKLFDVNAKLQIVPQLAAAMPRISDHGRTYTISLRTGIRFNDGTPLTAAAVRTSLIRDKTNKLSQRTSELTSVRSVQVVDQHTVRLKLSAPFAPLTSVLADRSGMVMSPKALAAEKDKFGQHPVCVGPFEFQNRPSTDEINLKKSPYYYDREHVHLAGIHFTVVTDGPVRATDIRSGDVDVVDRAEPQDLATLESDSNLHVRAVTSLGYQGIDFNVGNAHGATKAPATPSNTPFATRQKLRKAFELTLDRNVINEVVFDGAYEPTCTPLPPGEFAVKLGCSHRNIAEAKRLIRSSGMKAPIPVQLIVENDPQDEQLATVIQAMAKDGGFDVSLEPTEFDTLLTRAQNGQFQTVAVGWSGRLDPDQNISAFVTPKSSLNYSAVHDPGINSLVARARATQDLAARRALYKQLAELLNERLPIIYLYREKYDLVTSSHITGVQFYGDGLIRLGQARLTSS
jgi:peptide/nickel transport system substrate-binding protein